jgi:hypothetical protein
MRSHSPTVQTSNFGVPLPGVMRRISEAGTLPVASEPASRISGQITAISAQLIRLRVIGSAPCRRSPPTANGITCTR